ncbi:hypothetical protein F5984_24180 [Rudanella paleaurantiibacter]|uniref:Uncharacterized protein n=1 Tax=Rudanella paleaurantiibacter TaxID=2614655 RepID=A0A7J5TSM3_9BACT|nr:MULTISPECIES: hypothetical protein [Rudanella]KAB7726422.1 hypothetical protein F5984_24180 [Rudanella paleaurantiibacter]
MGLFGFINRPPQPEPGERTQDHPAFRFGKLVAGYMTRLEHRFANTLNQGQHRIGFGARNTLLVILGTFFLLYFIALLTR